MNAPLHRICAVALLALMPAASAAWADELRNVKVGDEVPAFSLATLGGETVRSADLKGSAVILVFLAAHQNSSEAAAAGADAVYRRLRREKLTLMFVTADTASTVYFRQQRDKTGLHEPLGLDFERKLYGDLGLIVLPTTIVIDQDWKLRQVISAYKSDFEHVLEAYARHTLGLINDEQLEKLLTTETFRRDRPEDKIARHRATALLLRKNSLWLDAENELRAALEIDATHAGARLDLASLYLTTDRLAEAEQIVAEVLAENPYERRGTLLHGIVFYRTDRLAEAEKVLRDALVLNPDPVHTHYYLGLIYEKKGDTAKALHHYKESLSRLLEDRPL